MKIPDASANETCNFEINIEIWYVNYKLFKIEELNFYMQTEENSGTRKYSNIYFDAWQTE